MAKRKLSRDQKRKKKKQQRKRRGPKRASQRLIKRVKKVGFDTQQIVYNQPGQEKMSEVLMDFIAPYKHVANTTEAMHKLITTALVAWNASLLPEEEQAGSVQQIAQALPDEAVDDFYAIVEEMTERKKRHFARYDRMIIDYELVDRGDDYHVTVMSLQNDQEAKAASGDAQMIEVLPPDDRPSEADDPQFARILQILGAQEIPHVDAAPLSTYLNYLKTHLQLPCLVEGIESIGYFGWEERFEFGYGSRAEHKRLRKKFGSLEDKFELEALEGRVEPGWDMLVKVRRVGDGKRFSIPLSELEAVDKNSDNAVLLNDYTVWIVNWR